MSKVIININNQEYSVACKDGDEQRIKDLGIYIATKASSLARSFTDISEVNLLLMTNLIIADEISKLKPSLDEKDREIVFLKNKIKNLELSRELLEKQGDQSPDALSEDKIAVVLEKFSSKIKELSSAVKEELPPQ